MVYQQGASSKPQVIQGNFQGRPPAFAAQARPGVPGTAQRQRAPHLAAVLGQNAPGHHAAQRKAGLQPHAAQPKRFGNAFQVPEAVNLSGGGQGRPLPDTVRQQMESFFSTDFSDVRIHTGAQAKSIGAVAFTMGSEIHFAPGHYNPATAHGQRLLGHELTHVVQQRAGRVRNPFGSGIAVVQDQAMEAEANRMGLRAAVHRVTIQAKRHASAPRSINGPVVQLEQDPGWYYTTGVFSGANLRADNVTHSKIRQLNKNEVIEVIDKGGRVSNFNLPATFYSPTHEHSWVRTENGEFGWVEDSELRVAQKPHGRREYAEILAEQAAAREEAEARQRAQEEAAERQREEEERQRRREQARARKRLLPVLQWSQDDLSNDRGNMRQVNRAVQELLLRFPEDAEGYDENDEEAVIERATSKLKQHKYMLSSNWNEVMATLKSIAARARRKRYPMVDDVADILAKIPIPLSFLDISGSYMADRPDVDIRR